jgi:AcrR family transcriptional regulator
MTAGARVREKPERARTGGVREVRARKPNGFARSPAKAARTPTKSQKQKPVRESAREGARGVYREAIVHAAERVFSRRGFYETRMADIAKEAGVGVGTLYNYFDSKEVVFSELLRGLHTELRETVKTAASSEDPLERLRQIVGSALSVLGDKGHLFAVFMERGAIGECDVERLVGADRSQNYGEFLEIVERTVEDGIRAKRLRSDVDPKLLVSALSGAMNGAVYTWLRQGLSGRLSAVSEQLFQIFVQGAKVPAA